MNTHIRILFPHFIVVSLATIAMILSSGCGSPQKDLEISNPHFVTMMGPQAAAMRHVFEPEFRLCVNGAGATNDKKTEVKEALNEWLEAIRDLHSEITDTISFSCNSPHLTATINSGFGTGLGGSFGMTLWSQKGKGETLHELGHAFAGLGDTYIGGQAGRCLNGQPESIMCWGDYGSDSLYPDDIAGIRRQFQNLMASGVGPANGNNQPTRQPAEPDHREPGANINPGALADDDGDGVPNYLDLCRNTPNGEWVHQSDEWRGCAAGQFRN